MREGFEKAELEYVVGVETLRRSREPGSSKKGERWYLYKGADI